MRNSTRRGARVMDHFIERDREAYCDSPAGVGQRIADQRDVHADFFDETRRCGVVTRQRDDRLFLIFFVLKGENRLPFQEAAMVTL